MTVIKRPTIVRAAILVLAYALAGPVWFTTTVEPDGLVTKYKRFGVFRWMDRDRSYFVNYPEDKKGGTFIRRPGLIASSVAFGLLFAVACAFEYTQKRKAQQDGRSRPSTAAGP